MWIPQLRDRERRRGIARVSGIDRLGKTTVRLAPVEERRDTAVGSAALLLLPAPVDDVASQLC